VAKGSTWVSAGPAAVSTVKVLLVTSFAPPEHTSGTETYTFGLAQGLQAAGYEVQLLCAGSWTEGSKYWNGHDEDTYGGVPIRRLRLNWTRAPDPNRFLYDNPKVATFFRNYVEEIQPDVVHVTSCYTLSASPIRVAKQAGLPVVLTLTDYWFLCPRVTLLRSDEQLCDGVTTSVDCLRCMLRDAKAYRWSTRWLPLSVAERLLTAVSRHPAVSRRRGLRGMALDMDERKRVLGRMLELPDYVLAPSAFLAETFRRNGCQRRIEIQPHGHDLGWLAADTGKTPSASLRFGYLGQLVPIKGVHLLLEAFRRTCQDDSATLTIYGPWPQTAYAERLAELADGDERIVFAGGYSRSRLGEIFAAIDCLVVPSLCHENAPLVIQEAFASRTPIVASDVGGIREMIRNEQNGLLFARGEVDELARQLRRLMTDDELLTRIRGASPPVKPIQQEVEELGEIYSRVHGARLRRP
jgi:glycosyltransferase involved in cell wall biosynthesis